MKTSELLNKKVLTINEGKELGHVHDFLIDNTLDHIEYIVLSKGQFFSKAKAIPKEEIVSYGDNAVMVKEFNSLETGHTVKSKINRLYDEQSDIKRMQVHTTQGEKIGYITDVTIDENGKILDFVVSENMYGNFVKSPETMKQSDVITFGEDSIIIDYTNETTERLSTQETNASSNPVNEIRKTLKESKSNLEETKEQAMKKVEEEILGKELTKDLYSVEVETMIAKKGQKVDPLTLNRIKKHNLMHQAAVHSQ